MSDFITENDPRYVIWKFFCDEHNLTLTDGELDDIIAEIEVQNQTKANDEIKEQKTALHLRDVSNSMLVNWLYLDENSTEVTVIGIVNKWCVVEDNEHVEPYCVELEYVRQMYIDSIDC